MHRKIAVVGAGVAGISAALNLAEKGFEVHLFEQKNSIGGRLSSIYDNFSEEYIDNGQHLLIGAYHNFLQFLQKIKVDSQIQAQKSLKVKFIDALGSIDILDTSLFKGKLGVIFGFLRLKNIDLIDKINLIIFLIKIQFNISNFENLNCLEYLRLNNQSQNMIMRFWDPLILAILNNSPENSSAELLTNSLKNAFFSKSDNSKLIFPKTDLNSLIQNFIPLFENYNGKIYLNHKIKKINIVDSQIKSIEVNDNEYVFDEYIFAVTPNVLMKILSSEQVRNNFDYLEKFTYSPIISAYFWFDKPVFFEKFAATLNTKIQWIFNRRAILNPAKFKLPESLSVTISNAENITNSPNSEISNTIFEELKHLLAIPNDTKLLHSRVIKELMATIAITPDVEKIRPNAITAITNLYLAGDWTNTKLPATIEGACLSGLTAANLIENHK